MLEALHNNMEDVIWRSKSEQCEKRIPCHIFHVQLVTLVSLSLILYVGKVIVGGAVTFVLIYAIYAFVVAANEILRKHARRLTLVVVTLLFLVKGSAFSQGNQEDDSIYSTLLDNDTESDTIVSRNALPQ
ncbi:unnamed protein product [Camellia sinensis]